MAEGRLLDIKLGCRARFSLPGASDEANEIVQVPTQHS